MENKNTKEILGELYEQLADLVPEALAEDFLGMGYAKGKYYDDAGTRILVVEKVPRPNPDLGNSGGGGCDSGEDCRGCGHEAARRDAADWEDEKDFTGVISRIAHNILGVSAAEWPEHVAWTYLYKLAPKRGKADSYLYQKQKALCEEIIKAEIEELRPDLILFVTGWGSVWDFDLPLSPLLKGEAVEAWGLGENGARLIVTRYAVRKPEDRFASDILSKIKLLEELRQGKAGI